MESVQDNRRWKAECLHDCVGELRRISSGRRRFTGAPAKGFFFSHVNPAGRRLDTGAGRLAVANFPKSPRYLTKASILNKHADKLRTLPKARSCHCGKKKKTDTREREDDA